MPVMVRLLGPLEVVAGSRQVVVSGVKERSLIVLLALHAGRVVPAAELIDGLWDREPPASAEASLRVLVARVRKALAAAGAREVLRTRPPGYVLDVEKVDAHRFEQLARRGRAELAAGAPHMAAAVLAEALGLWRGERLAEIGTERLRAESARWEEARLGLVEARVDAELACGRHAELLGELELLCRQYPLRERLWAQRITALYRCGRQADALAVYQQLRVTLGEELGIDPSPPLRRLEAAVLAQEPGLDGPAPPLPSEASADLRHDPALLPHALAPSRSPTPVESVRGPEWPLSGRSEEIQRLHGLLRTESHGIVVMGEPGIGKSRLCAEFVRAGREGGHPVLQLSATAHARDIPLGCLAHLVSTDGPPASGSGQGDLVRAAVSVIIGLTRQRQRLIVFIDDVHLADPSTVTVLEQALRASNLFLIATGRSREVNPLLALWKDAVIDRLDLRPMPDADMAALAAYALDGPMEARSLSRILHLSGGSPLYLRELINGARSAEALETRDELWALADEFKPSGRLIDIVAERLRHLTATQTAAMQVVALAEPVPFQVVERVTDLDAILALEAQHLVRVDEIGASTVLLPSHPVYGEVIRAQLPPLRRRQAARALARAFLESGLASDAYAIQHALLSLEGGVALPTTNLESAARQAHTRGDHQLTLKLAHAALESGGGTAAALAAAEAAAALVRPDVAEEYYRQASQRAKTSEDETAVVISRARGLLYGNDTRRAFELLEQARQTQREPAAGHALLLAIVEFKAYTGEWAEAIQLAGTLDEPDVPRATRFAAGCVEAFAASFAGPHPRATAAARRSAHLLPQIDHPSPVHVAYLEIAKYQVQLFSGELDKAVASCLERVSRATTGVDHPDYAGLWSWIGAMGACLAGSVTRTTRQLAENGVRLLRRRDTFNLNSLAVSVAALTAALADDLARAEELLEHYDRDLRPVETKTTAFADRARAWIALRTAGPDAAAEHIVRAAQTVLHRTQNVDVALYAAPMLHDAVRFGRPGLVVDDLRELANRLAAPLATAMSDHARAAAAGDPLAQADAAEKLIALGARQLGAEALAQLNDDRHTARIAALTADEIVVPPPVY